MSHLSSVPERNRDRRPRERLAGSTGWERACDRTVTVKHFCLMEELALEISTATNEDGLFEALARASMRLGFDHFALAYEQRSSCSDAFNPFIVNDYHRIDARKVFIREAQ